MDFTEFNTGKDDEGRRLDKIIRIFIPSITLSNIYKSLRKGLIKVNNKTQEPSYKICTGDIIKIATLLLKDKPAENPQKTTYNKLKIVFENKHLLVIDKPAGINVQKASKEEISLTDLVLQYVNSQKKRDSLSFKCGPMHRIDKMTCGLVCFSKSTGCAVWFTNQMKNHTIKKQYYAIVQGKILKEEIWQDNIIKETSKNDEKKLFQKVKVINKQIKDSDKNEKLLQCITKIKPLKVGNLNNQTLSFVNCQIETGRKHQIRSQASFHGHSLWGDTAYNGKFDKFNNGKYFLQAYKIEFPQNEFDIPKQIEIELAPELKNIIEKLED